MEDQGPSSDAYHTLRPDVYTDSWYSNSHITGLGISISGNCGIPNETFQAGCVICGKSSIDIKEEITLGYLGQTHIAGETYDQRMARRHAFQAGLRAGSYILIPWGVSQAAACDGTLYQMMPTYDTLWSYYCYIIN